MITGAIILFIGIAFGLFIGIVVGFHVREATGQSLAVNEYGVIE